RYPARSCGAHRAKAASGRLPDSRALREPQRHYGFRETRAPRYLSAATGPRRKTGAVSKIKVIVVDDSAVVRQVNRETLTRESDIEVIAVCPHPVAALEKMQRQWPDVIVTDIEMPRMDGITFLKKVMALRPTPTVICSSLTEEGAATTMETLTAGALAIITKPKLGIKQFLQEAGNDLVSAVRAAASANMTRVRTTATRPHSGTGATATTNTESDVAPPQPLDSNTGAMHNTTEKVVAIGTSTGGIQALETVLTQLPRTSTGIVVVQHMPEKFTAMFALRLNALCAMEVREAQDGDR